MQQLKIDVISLFPEFFDSPLKQSLIGKALQNKVLEINLHQLRDFSSLPHKSVDSSPYGGGPGMVLRADVLSSAVKHLRKEGSLVILLDPSGLPFRQTLAAELSQKTHLILICGRYEGVDERFKQKYVDMQLSIGDYVINGGEAAALVVIEAVSRLVAGVIGEHSSTQEESFSENNGEVLLEYPQYTRPDSFESLEVPEILKSGDHGKIKAWRTTQAREKTSKLRPDLAKS